MKVFKYNKQIPASEPLTVLGQELIEGTAPEGIYRREVDTARRGHYLLVKSEHSGRSALVYLCPDGQLEPGDPYSGVKLVRLRDAALVMEVAENLIVEQGDK